MTDLVTLVLPLGQVTWSFPISHGTDFFMPYRADAKNPDSAWHVDVPRHVAKHLLHNGGFAVAAPSVHVLHSAGSIRLIHRDGPAACNWQGMKFAPEPDGAITVPVEALAELQSHGFIVPPAGFGVAPQETILSPALAAELAKIAQGTDTTGHVWAKDADGTAHPEEAASTELPPMPPAPDLPVAAKKKS